MPVMTLFVLYVAVGVVMLVWQYRRLDGVTDATERRRVKAILAGTVAGLVPGMHLLSSPEPSSALSILAAVLVSNLLIFGTMTPLIFPGVLTNAVLRHGRFDLGGFVPLGVRSVRRLRGTAWLREPRHTSAVRQNEQCGIGLVALARRSCHMMRSATVFSRTWRVGSRTSGGPAADQTRSAASRLHVGSTPRDASLDAPQAAMEARPFHQDEAQRHANLATLGPIRAPDLRDEAVLVCGPTQSKQPNGQDERDVLASEATALLPQEETEDQTSPVAPFEQCPVCCRCYDAGTLECPHDGARLIRGHLPRTLGGRYRLERQLGAGGFGAVYAAIDEALDRQVAVKVIREDGVAHPDRVPRFRAEARLAAQFVHRNAVTVHDFGIAGKGRPFLVMELLEGRTLRDELGLSPVVPPARALAILRDVCAAVDAAHRRRMVHGDLKPDNIFLTSDGVVETAKVLDFGLARMLNDARDVPADADFLAGTLRYMSPAQLQGHGVDAAADLWALAVIAYELIVGVHPFAWLIAGPFTMMPMDAGAAIMAPLADAPEAWGPLFQRALSLDAARRPQTASALFAACAAAIGASAP